MRDYKLRKINKKERLMRKYFGTDGIRRIANTELTPDLVFRVAKAGAYVLSKHSEHTPTILILLLQTLILPL